MAPIKPLCRWTTETWRLRSLTEAAAQWRPATVRVRPAGHRPPAVSRSAQRHSLATASRQRRPWRRSILTVTGAPHGSSGGAWKWSRGLPRPPFIVSRRHSNPLRRHWWNRKVLTRDLRGDRQPRDVIWGDVVHFHGNRQNDNTSFTVKSDKTQQ